MEEGSESQAGKTATGTFIGPVAEGNSAAATNLTSWVKKIGLSYVYYYRLSSYAQQRNVPPSM